MKKRLKAIKKCTEWLTYCLKIGWSKQDLDSLEALWWKYHDSWTGNLTLTH
ncbi:hypothetical protein LCGC14_1113890 [marine sediment metagenome]|uniref:Uncharacterized protein n=1 Tax=marine sediment metagenome TaxID=412755 RepID=A0A0F9PP34_9ZZZZ